MKQRKDMRMRRISETLYLRRKQPQRLFQSGQNSSRMAFPPQLVFAPVSSNVPLKLFVARAETLGHRGSKSGNAGTSVGFSMTANPREKQRGYWVLGLTYGQAHQQGNSHVGGAASTCHAGI